MRDAKVWPVMPWVTGMRKQCVVVARTERMCDTHISDKEMRSSAQRKGDNAVATVTAQAAKTATVKVAKPTPTKVAARALTPAQARAFLLRRAGGPLHAEQALPDVLALVHAIGYLQIDPVAVVAAMHHLIARTRLPHYTPADLDAALYRDRTLVETFPHIHAVVPIAHWRHYDQRTSPPYRIENDDPETVARVLATITERGPLASRHFTTAEDREHIVYGWGNTPRVQAALHALARRGAILVHHREGTEKVYDLAERLVPSHVDVTPVTDAERALHVAARELTYGGLTGRSRLAPAISNGDAVPVEVEGVRGTWYVPAAEWDGAQVTPPVAAGEGGAHLLAPLDPLVHDRKRLAALFGFDYTWEVYTPAVKRRYGPYTMPVLWGDRFVARIDPSLDRKSGTLHLRAVWFEPDAPDTAALSTDIAAEIARFAAFHSATTITLGPVMPDNRTGPLRAALESALTILPVAPA